MSEPRKLIRALLRVKGVRRRSVKGRRLAVKDVKSIVPHTLKPSNLASVKVDCSKIAVGQGVRVPSPDIIASTTSINSRLDDKK